MNTGSITKILLIKVAIPTDDIEETKKKIKEMRAS
jgi:hypothetical protein